MSVKYKPGDVRLCDFDGYYWGPVEWILPYERLPQDGQVVLARVKGNIGLFIYTAWYIDAPLRFWADIDFMSGPNCEPDSFAPHEIEGWMPMPA